MSKPLRLAIAGLGTVGAGVVRMLAENGDLTLDELCLELAGRGVRVHRSSIGRLLNRLGLSNKKKSSSHRAEAG